MSGRRWLATAGAVAVLLGVGVVIDPGLATAIGLATDRVVVLALAGLALLQGLVAVAGRLTGRRRTAAPPEVEARIPAAVPGTAFDERLADLPDHRVQRRDEERAAVRERLEGVAVDVLVARGLDEPTARRHLAAGTWTDDERAAALFVPAADRELSLGARMRDAFGSELAFARRARRAVAAIAAHADGAVPPPGADGAEERTASDGDTPAVDGAAASGQSRRGAGGGTAGSGGRGE